MGCEGCRKLTHTSTLGKRSGIRPKGPRQEATVRCVSGSHCRGSRAEVQELRRLPSTRNATAVSNAVDDAKVFSEFAIVRRTFSRADLMW